MTVDLHTTGLDEAARLLQAVPVLMRKNAYATALAAAAIPLSTELFNRTPIGAGLRPEELELKKMKLSERQMTRTSVAKAKTLFTSVRRQKGKEVIHLHLKGAIVADIAVDSEAQGAMLSIGFGRLGYRARFVELGHRMVGHQKQGKPLLKGNPVVPHPFMAPAAMAAAEATVQAFVDVLTASLNNQLQEP